MSHATPDFMESATLPNTTDVNRVGSGPLVQPVAWEVEINYMSCIVFATTKAKAKWLAVEAYWEAYSKNGSWPHTSIARRPLYDRFPYREPKAYSPEYVRSLC